jgi:hypothetical protein
MCTIAFKSNAITGVDCLPVVHMFSILLYESVCYEQINMAVETS